MGRGVGRERKGGGGREGGIKGNLGELDASKKWQKEEENHSTRPTMKKKEKETETLTERSEREKRRTARNGNRANKMEEEEEKTRVEQKSTGKILSNIFVPSYK